MYKKVVCYLRPWIPCYLNGFSQIMLQENSITGLFFIMGVMVNSVVMLAGALAGSAISLVTAVLLNYDKQQIQQGWFGYNGALVGLCVFFVFPVTLLSCIFLFLGAALSSLLMTRFLRFTTLPPYTAPFVISAWFSITSATYFGQTHHVTTSIVNDISLIEVIFKGVGQVMFLGDALVGALFLCGLVCCSYKTGLFALLGSVVGLSIALILDFPHNMVSIGFYGFNSALVGIALAQRSLNYFFMTLFTMVLAALMTRVFQLLGIIGLTAPFFIALWLVQLSAVKFKKSETI